MPIRSVAETYTKNTHNVSNGLQLIWFVEPAFCPNHVGFQGNKLIVHILWSLSLQQLHLQKCIGCEVSHCGHQLANCLDYFIQKPKYSIIYIYLSDCGGNNVSISNGVFQSPGYPYGNIILLNCSYQISVPTGLACVYFTDFDVELYWDSVTVIDNGVIRYYGVG